MTKCLIEGCDGELRSKGAKQSGGFLYNHKRTEIPKGTIYRLRVCNKCKKRIITLEIPYEKIIKDAELIKGLKGLLEKYVDDILEMPKEWKQ